MVAEPHPPPSSPHPDDEIVLGYADCEHRLETHRWSDPVCEQMSAAVDALADLDPTGDGDALQLGRLRDISRLIDRLEAQRLRLLSHADTAGAIERGGAATTSTWLRRTTTLTSRQAATRRRVAARLDQLPAVAAAFADGVIGVTHADHIDRLARDTGVEDVDKIQTDLVEAAVHLQDVGEFSRLCTGLRNALRPEALDERDAAAYERRRFSAAATMDGIVPMGGCLDAEGGAYLLSALDAFTVADPDDVPVELRRTVEQRRADALVHMAKNALDSAGLSTVAGQRPHVTLRASLDTLAGVPGAPPAELDRIGAIGRELAQRILGDSAITRLLIDQAGQPLDVGTATRVWPAGVRRAITDRDRGCRFPGCPAPVTWCEIDHVIPWEPDEHGRRGPTAYDNGILICKFHHRKAKHPDRWWPTLHADGTVTWVHPVHGTRTSHPRGAIDGHVQQILHQDEAEEPDAGAGDIAGEEPVAYRAGSTPDTVRDAPSMTASRAPPTSDPGRPARPGRSPARRCSPRSRLRRTPRR